MQPSFHQCRHLLLVEINRLMTVMHWDTSLRLIVVSIHHISM